MQEKTKISLESNSLGVAEFNNAKNLIERWNAAGYSMMAIFYFIVQRYSKVSLTYNSENDQYVFII